VQSIHASSSGSPWFEFLSGCHLRVSLKLQLVRPDKCSDARSTYITTVSFPLPPQYVYIHPSSSSFSCMARQTNDIECLPFSKIQNLIYRQLVRILGRGIGLPQGPYLHKTRKEKTDIHPCSSVGFQHPIPMLKRYKTVHALSWAVTDLNSACHPIIFYSNYIPLYTI
jgi:hypothetical protein